ncbi:MAG: hypothetical protein D6735_05725 [Acidobacteria bacterium]|jgi:glycosyltransferase involved in cell wall biosynthesis|nr:MAG: hypothetical protein D6735_05725 [Acidobacteriota bacterium]
MLNSEFAKYSIIYYDLDAITSSIAALLQNRDLRMHLGQQARRVMVEEWDWRVRGEQIIRVVQS